MTKKKIDEQLHKLELGVKVFAYSALNQAVATETLVVSGLVGLKQGLKYTGDFNRGLKAGLATTAVISGIAGIRNVVDNMETINDILKREA